MTVNVATTSLADNIAYRADGLPTSLAYGNGLTKNRTYDLRGELTGQTLGSETRNYAYDLNGNLTQAIRASGTSLYGYDALDQLMNEASAAVGSLGYSYDPNGNRLSLLDNAAPQTYAYSPNTNRLTQVGHKDITLDAAGNTLSDQNGKRRFEYLASGRLFKVHKERKWVATYLYNAQGQRTQKQTKHGITVYHYDQQGRLIAETSDRGVLQRAYVWLEDQPLAQIDRHGKGEEKSKKAKPAKESVAYLHVDHLATPRLATDTNQQIVWRWDSDAFGTKKPENLDDDHEDDGHDITVNLRFPGQYADKETKLHYNWHRYYDPKIGRYVTSDPIGLRGGLNTYLYARANPLRYTDPTGLIADCISYILGISRREWQEIEETILAQFNLPVPIPTGWGVGPGGPRQPPIGPEIQFDLWEVEYTLAAQRIYLLTQVIQHLQVFCEETREGECGKTETFRTSFKMDKALDPTKTLIDERLDWRHRLIRLLGRGGFGF